MAAFGRKQPLGMDPSKRTIQLSPNVRFWPEGDSRLVRAIISAVDPKATLESVGMKPTGERDMTTSLQSLFLAALILAVSPQLVAAETNQVRDAIRLVVITENEGIHYERGCAFYEFRELLAENESNALFANDLSDAPLFEVRLIGKSGNSTIYVGDHWMSTTAGTALLPSKAYERIAALVEMRKGEGVPESKIDMSIRRASKRIQDPNFVEENRCAEQY